MMLENSSATLPSTKANIAVRRFALGGWALIVLANLLFFIIDLATDYSDMLVPCAGMLGSGGECNFLSISPAEVVVLSSWGLTLRAYALAMLVSPVILLLVYWTLGSLILWRQGSSWLGLTVSLALMVVPVATVSSDNDWSGNAPILFLLAVTVAAMGNTIVETFLYLMPNGRFSPHWAYIPLIATNLLTTILVLEINDLVAFPAQTVSILRLSAVGLVLFGGGLQVYRYLYDANSVERQQTRWIIFGVFSYFVSIILWVLIFGSAVTIPAGNSRLLINLGGWFFINTFSLLILPVAITIAILRYKLWNIDLIINRTLVYGGLTLGVVSFYVVTVGGVSLLFQTSGNFVISLISTGLIAVAFNPVRERLQRSINRVMYGQRDDPYAVLSQLSQRLQTTAMPTETLTLLVETIATMLKLPYVAIELVEQEERIGQASVGEAVADMVDFPLRYQNELVGRLRVSPRTTDEKFMPQEQQLLTDIAAQTGPAASATRLTLALLHSREKLVLAREEERRRIRRDLHDGFGPNLASHTLQLDLVLDSLAEQDTPSAIQRVEKLKYQTQQMVADIRRLVYELRPPALDELGVLEALRAHVAQMDDANGQLQVVVAATPEPLPPLPAAIEVAVYRIALEGVTNVIRHAHAHACRVHITMTDHDLFSTLVLTITDDGIGMTAKHQPGVGLTSMRERVEEVGGTYQMSSNPRGGTRITAVLPFAVGGEI